MIINNLFLNLCLYVSFSLEFFFVDALLSDGHSQSVRIKVSTVTYSLFNRYYVWLFSAMVGSFCLVQFCFYFNSNFRPVKMHWHISTIAVVVGVCVLFWLVHLACILLSLFPCPSRACQRFKSINTEFCVFYTVF